MVCAQLHDGTVVVICYNSYGYQLLSTRRQTQNLLNGVGELDREISHFCVLDPHSFIIKIKMQAFSTEFTRALQELNLRYNVETVQDIVPIFTIDHFNSAIWIPKNRISIVKIYTRRCSLTAIEEGHDQLE